MGSVVTVYIESASRWNVAGRVVSVLFQPPGSPAIQIASGTVTSAAELSDRVESCEPSQGASCSAPSQASVMTRESALSSSCSARSDNGQPAAADAADHQTSNGRMHSEADKGAPSGTDPHLPSYQGAVSTSERLAGSELAQHWQPGATTCNGGAHDSGICCVDDAATSRIYSETYLQRPQVDVASEQRAAPESRSYRETEASDCTTSWAHAKAPSPDSQNCQALLEERGKASSATSPSTQIFSQQESGSTSAASPSGSLGAARESRSGVSIISDSTIQTGAEKGQRPAAQTVLDPAAALQHNSAAPVDKPDAKQGTGSKRVGAHSVHGSGSNTGEKASTQQYRLKQHLVDMGAQSMFDVVLSAFVILGLSGTLICGLLMLYNSW